MNFPGLDVKTVPTVQIVDGDEVLYQFAAGIYSIRSIELKKKALAAGENDDS